MSNPHYVLDSPQSATPPSLQGTELTLESADQPYSQQVPHQTVMKNITITVPEDAIVNVRMEEPELEPGPLREGPVVPAPAPEELIVIRFRGWVEVIAGRGKRAKAFQRLFEQIDAMDSDALYTLYGNAMENTRRTCKCLGNSVDEVFFDSSESVEDRKERCARLSCGLYLFTNVGFEEILNISPIALRSAFFG